MVACAPWGHFNGGTSFECSRNSRSFPGEFDNVGQRRDVPNGRPQAPYSRRCVRFPIAGCEVEFCSGLKKSYHILIILYMFSKEKSMFWHLSCETKANSTFPRFLAWRLVSFCQGIDSILNFQAVKAAKAGPVTIGWQRLCHCQTLKHLKSD